MPLVSSMGAGSDFRCASESEAIAQAGEIQLVHAFDDAVEFLLQAIVGADIEVAFEQRVDGVVEILFGVVGLAGSDRRLVRPDNLFRRGR